MDFSTSPPGITRIIIVHVPVNSETGQMDIGSLVVYADEKKQCAEGWEWRKFQLIEAE
jgi:hypothetical protein